MNKIEIKNADSGNVIKSILKDQPQLNYNQIKTAIRKKDLRVDGVKIKEEISLNGGENIELFLPDAKEKEIPVIFEDDNVVIANKPQGMEVTLKDKVFDKSKCLEEFFVPFKAVHRLDKNTEGLVILAKNDKVYDEFVDGFKHGAILKHYLALVAGKPKPESANLSDYLTKEDGYSKVFKRQVEGSDLIKTNYHVVKSNADTSMLDIELLTGKTHQIRAHLAMHDIFIIGDEKYGNMTINKKFKKHVQCLCAYSLKFNFSKQNPLNYLNAQEFEIRPSFDLMTLKSSNN